jgi:acetyl-CoA acyltransferase 1
MLAAFLAVDGCLGAYQPCLFCLCVYKPAVLVYLEFLQVTISADDGIRPGTTAASLSSLKTVFKRDGTTTAGNSSQVSVAVGTRHSGACLAVTACMRGELKALQGSHCDGVFQAADGAVVTDVLPAVLQVTDGASAVLMMTRREAMNRGLPVLGIFRSFSAVGVDPAIMGVGPAVAIPAAVAQVRSHVC